MDEIVHMTTTALQGLAADKNLTLRTTVQPQLPRGKGDERRITQVILNLLGNAIKFTEAGEVHLAVTVSGDDFVVSVSDTGMGIAESDQARIFEEFQQVDNASSHAKGGTGLGLSISKRIVELHGGRIWVKSRPGEGSVFSFTLPIQVQRQVGV